MPTSEENKISNKTPDKISDLFPDTATPLAVKATYTDELVIALCGPIGSPLHKVGDAIKKILETDFEYNCKVIKLSGIIEKYAGTAPDSSKYERIKYLIDKGNALREKYGKSILADLAISEIAAKRPQTTNTFGAKRFVSQRVCHVIDSIKNQEELEALKSVYREALYFIGVSSPVLVRQSNLEKQPMTLPEVYNLMDRDSGEEVAHGQTVRETFPHADFFLGLDSGSDPQLSFKIKRFLNIIFGAEIETPSHGETAMYLASSAAGNSACLSRQVGAAITDEKGEIISVGWNDVPKFGGNLYQYLPDEDAQKLHDKRCVHMEGGKCFNDIEKRLIATEIVNELEISGVLKEDAKNQAINAVLSSKIKNLIEFSRSIHAEMHAIIMGSQMAGTRVKGGILYCTTYPCHSCARHIIVAGIKEVYYIEPYRKSLATKLHEDAITAIADMESEVKKVRILSFDGVAPSRYLKMFRMKTDSRKDVDGKLITIDRKRATPMYEVSLESLPALEAIVVNHLAAKNLIPV
ncbi:MAG: deoxycytidylate deaminase [Deltaproteobacteria bacterium]|nr:deoxycytidylate deaminase [Deltaproteobacteria bacterium]